MGSLDGISKSTIFFEAAMMNNDLILETLCSCQLVREQRKVRVL